MRCAKCLKIMRHATIRSQICEHTDRNAIILLIILFTFLSPPNTYLSPSATQLSLSLFSGLHLSVAPYFFLTFIFFYLSLSSSLSAFRYHHQRSDPIHAQNFSYTSPSCCTAVRFSASLARFALLIGSIHPRP